MVTMSFLFTFASTSLAYYPQPAPAVPPGQVRPVALPDDATEFAREFAPKVADLVTTATPRGGLVLRVLVLPFGDAAAGGRATRATAETPREIQGSLARALTALAKSRFVVIGPEELRPMLLRENIDVSALDPADPPATARALDKLGLWAVVFGTFQDHETTATVRMTVVTADEAKARTIEGRAGPRLVSRTADPRARHFRDSRFRLEILLVEPGPDGGEENATRTPLALKQYVPPADKVGATPGGVDPLTHAYVIELDRSMRGKRVAVRLTNLGKGSGAMVNSPEKEVRRVETAVVRVEGVDTLAHEVGGELRLLTLPPDQCRRWVMSGPGDVLVPDGRNPKGYRLERGGRRGDHSVLEIPGYQIGRTGNQPFIVTVPRESVASQLGLSSELGVISVHTYPEILEGDRPLAETLGDVGFAAGATIEHPTFPVKIDTYQECDEVFHVFFVEKDDPNSTIPQERLVGVPVTE